MSVQICPELPRLMVIMVVLINSQKTNEEVKACIQRERERVCGVSSGVMINLILAVISITNNMFQY